MATCSMVRSSILVNCGITSKRRANGLVRTDTKALAVSSRLYLRDFVCNGDDEDTAHAIFYPAAFADIPRTHHRQRELELAFYACGLRCSITRER
jgi:hypothetical protein